MLISNRPTQLNCSVQFKQRLYCPFKSGRHGSPNSIRAVRRPPALRRLNILRQFTYDEAVEILYSSRYWDFSLDRDRIPKCAGRWRSLLEDQSARFKLLGGCKK